MSSKNTALGYVVVAALTATMTLMATILFSGQPVGPCVAGERSHVSDVVSQAVHEAVRQAFLEWSDSSSAQVQKSHVQDSFSLPAVPAEVLAEHRKRVLGGPAIRTIEDVYVTLVEYQKVLDASVTKRTEVIGNIAWFPTQVLYYYNTVRQPNVRNVCEVGFGAGHSAIIYLVTNPHVSVYSFDIFPTPAQRGSGVEIANKQPEFQRAGLQFINSNFPGRLHTVAGDSRTSIPSFHEQNPGLRCDVIVVDGSHTPPIPYLDIKNFAPFSSADTVLLLDDMHYVKGDLDRAVKDGVVEEIECIKTEVLADTRFANYAKYDAFGGKAFCRARYTQ